MFDPGVRPGKLVVKGTRLLVEDLVRLVEEGRSDEDLLRRHPELAPEDVGAIRQYALRLPACGALSAAGPRMPRNSTSTSSGAGVSGRSVPGDRAVSFLLDSDTSSAYLKGNRKVHGRVIPYGGQLHGRTVTMGELFAWALRRQGVSQAAPRPQRLPQGNLNVGSAHAGRWGLKGGGQYSVSWGEGGNFVFTNRKSGQEYSVGTFGRSGSLQQSYNLKTNETGYRGEHFSRNSGDVVLTDSKQDKAFMKAFNASIDKQVGDFRKSHPEIEMESKIHPKPQAAIRRPLAIYLREERH